MSIDLSISWLFQLQCSRNIEWILKVELLVVSHVIQLQSAIEFQ